MDLKKLGERYKNLRLSIKEKDPVSIKKLSELIGILPPRISELENGKRDMSLTELKAYHKYFKVSFEYLLGETDVSSTNEDIKIACKVTGLNDHTIKVLKMFNSTVFEKVSTASEVFEILVDDYNFIYLLFYFYLISVDSSSLVEKMGHCPNKNKIKENNDIEKIYHRIEFLSYKATRLFEMILEQFKHPDYNECMLDFADFFPDSFPTKFFDPNMLMKEDFENAEHNPTKE